MNFACTLLVLATIGFSLACGLEPMPTATSVPSTATQTPLPTPQQVVSDDMVAITECLHNRMAGALKRPRSGEYASPPYINELPEIQPGGTISREIILGYQRKYEGPIIYQIAEDCSQNLYGSAFTTSQRREFEAMEASKAGAMIAQTGLLSADMNHNCEQWEELRHLNYRALRADSVTRRGDESGLLFDYAWHSAIEIVSKACVPYFRQRR